MKSDPVKRQYLDDSGRVIPASQVRKFIDEYVKSEQKEVDRQAQKLLVGAISVAVFFDFLRKKVTDWHSLTGVIAYGGNKQMTPERWKRINSKILSELTYLNRFEQEALASTRAAQTIAARVAASLEIPAGLEIVVQEHVAEALLTAAPSEAQVVIRTAVKNALADSLGAEAVTVAETVTVDKAGAILDQLIGGTIPNRAGMYADAAYSTYENNVRAREADNGVTLARRICEEDEQSCDECVQAASDDFVSLAEVTDIGTLTCLNNCRCSYEFSYEGVEPLRIDETVNEIFARV